MAFVTMTVDTKKVMAMLEKQSLKGRVVSQWGVRYSTYYAMYVHENLQVHHPVGQAKFLEEPARRYAPLFARNAAKMLRHKKNLGLAMYDNAKLLLSLSQPLVPVDTGRLKASGRVVMGVQP